MVSNESRLPASAAAPLQRNRTSLLAKVGWGILGATVVLWGASSISLLYGTSLSTGWSLLIVFVALSVVSLALIGTGGPLEKRLLQQQLPTEETELPSTDTSWEEQWERLMSQPVR